MCFVNALRILCLFLKLLLPQFGIKRVYKKLVVSQIFCIFMDELQQVTNLFDITTDCKATELFCIIDEFCKHFDAENTGNLLEDNSGVKRRRRAASLSDSETINDMLKNTAQIVHSRHRSVSNFITLGAYCFFDNKPKALQGYCIEDTKLLSLF